MKLTKTKKIIIGSLATVLIVSLTFALWPLPYTEIKMLAPQGKQGDAFGSSVAITSNTVVVGAYVANANFISKWNGTAWTKAKSLISKHANASLGDKVAIDGNTIVAIGAEEAEMRLHIYKWNNSKWIETTVTPSEKDRKAFWGCSLAVCNNTIVVGAMQSKINNQHIGAAFIYKWNGSTWAESIITASDGSAGDLFGCSVAIEKNTVVVGAARKGSGAVYVYRPNGSTWAESIITPSDGSADNGFGGYVAIDKNTIVAGARRKDSGAVYIYKWNGSTWTESIITASDGTRGDNFGGCVAIDGEVIAVGAPGDDASEFYNYIDRAYKKHYENIFGTTGKHAGAVYIYKWNGSKWAETKIVASNRQENAYFGETLALSGNTIAVGVQRDNSNGENAGAVYIYKLK